MSGELTVSRRAKIKRLRFSLLPQGTWVIEKAMALLPKDALIVNIGYEYDKVSWTMFVSSDTFEEVTEGQSCPEIVAKIDHKKKTVDLVMPLAAENFLDALEGL